MFKKIVIFCVSGMLGRKLTSITDPWVKTDPRGYEVNSTFDVKENGHDGKPAQIVNLLVVPEFRILAIAFCDQSATPGPDTWISAYDLHTRKYLGSVSLDRMYPESLAFNGKTRQLLVGSGDALNGYDIQGRRVFSSTQEVHVKNIACDAHGQIYITGGLTGNILHCTPEGKLVRYFTPPGTLGKRGHRICSSLAVNRSGTLFYSGTAYIHRDIAIIDNIEWKTGDYHEDYSVIYSVDYGTVPAIPNYYWGKLHVDGADQVLFPDFKKPLIQVYNHLGEKVGEIHLPGIARNISLNVYNGDIYATDTEHIWVLSRKK